VIQVEKEPYRLRPKRCLGLKLLFCLVKKRAHALIPSLLAIMLLAPADVFYIRVPQTSSAVMIDGMFSEGEWLHAVSVDVPGTARLYFQRSADFVYIAVRYTKSPSGIVDLYVSPREGEIFDLHASAKLGERQLLGNAFPDWSWWNNRDWTANISHIDSFEKRTFVPAPIREYQIRYSRFGSNAWRVRFDLTAMGVNNDTQSRTIFPRGTSDNSTTGWLQLNLE
jgi:hypothetical protein